MSFVIAIDGPAGAGKSTVARRVATELAYTYLDTGAMYRSVALTAIRSGVDPEDEAALSAIARDLEIEFSPLDSEQKQTVWAAGEDVTNAIRTPEVSDLTSRISAIPSVRTFIVEQQRRIARSAERGAILEGRDIGTVVLPNAQLKIFLSASPEERARRRLDEMRARGIQADAADTMADMRERDARDSGRSSSPLVAATDAIDLSTDGMDIDAVVARILELRRERTL
jgi:cytidylate kinase